MKQLVIILLCFLFVNTAKSQTFKEKEEKYTQVIGALTAVHMYNTYVSIGSISDGNSRELYDSVMVRKLMNEQIMMLNNIVTMLDDLIGSKTVTNQDDINYVKEAVSIFKGLSNQASLAIKLAQNKNTSTASAFNDQRKSNWKKITVLLEIEE